MSANSFKMAASHDPFVAHEFAERLFDALPDVVFFIKDRMGRHARVNQTLADRCAGGEKSRLIGRRPGEVFPPGLALAGTRLPRRQSAAGADQRRP
jgi:hypothetical protein